MGLHLKNELFICNDKFDFNFYSEVLNEFNHNYDFIKYKKEHFFKFIIYTSIKNINTKNYNVKKKNNEWLYFEKSEFIFYINNENIEFLWSYYILFCNVQFKKYFENKYQLEFYIKSLFLNEKIINYKDCILENQENEIKSTILKRIEFKDFIFNKYNFIVNEDKKDTFEKRIDKIIYISKDEILRLINNNNYYYPRKNIYKIIIKDYGNKKVNIIKYFDLVGYIKRKYNINNNKLETYINFKNNNEIPEYLLNIYNDFRVDKYKSEKNRKFKNRKKTIWKKIKNSDYKNSIFV